MGRTPCCEKVGLKRGRWTAREDEILTAYIRLMARAPAQEGCCKMDQLFEAGCEERQFSSDEEDVIIKLHAALGNKWSLIAGHLYGRTDNEIKNYWNWELLRYSRPMETLFLNKRKERRFD